MSHTYSVFCRCGDESNDWNHAEEELIKAVKSCSILHQLRKSGWWDEPKWQGYQFEGLARFLCSHYDHGGFSVKGEYQSDPHVPVIPDDLNFDALCLARVREEIDDLEQRLKELKARAGGGG